MPLSIKPFEELVASKIPALGDWTLLITLLIKHCREALKDFDQFELLFVIQLEQIRTIRKFKYNQRAKEWKFFTSIHSMDRWLKVSFLRDSVVLIK